MEEGYPVAEASDGGKRWPSITPTPDIVLLDALMPVMDGFTCALSPNYETLSSCDSPKGDSYAFTPVLLMITALEIQESVDRAFLVGASIILPSRSLGCTTSGVRRLIQQSTFMGS